jgi:hypothetical protein
VAVPEARFPVVQSTLLLASLKATVPVAADVTVAVNVTGEPYVGVVVEVVPPLPINLADAGMFALALWFERKEIVERKRARTNHLMRLSVVLSLLSILGSS